MSLDEREEHLRQLDKYYMSGTSYGQSASGTIYVLASALERADNDLLWYVDCHAPGVYTPIAIGLPSLVLHTNIALPAFPVNDMKNTTKSIATKCHD